MPRGPSRRIVVEIDPELKEELYSVLDREGLHLKQWFLTQVEDYLRDRAQLSLPLPFEESPMQGMEHR
jgi:hypothetical protein